MSEIVMIKITDLFVPKGGNGKLTNDFCMNNKGEYPVYSSNNTEVFGKINFSDYNGNYLTWSIVGCAGYITEVNNKFSITNNRGILIPTEMCKEIDLTYIKYIIEPIFRKNIKGRMGINGKNEYTTLNPAAVRKIKEKIPIPVKNDGTYDIEKQKELAEKYREIEEKKKTLLKKIEIMKSTKVVFNDDNQYVEVSITDLFTPRNGNGIYTKEWCQNHNGNIPLYSGNTYGVFDYIDTADYNGEYITWVKDGLAGYMHYHNEKFSLTGHRGILIPTDKCKNIDLQYVKYVLEPIFRSNIKGRMGIKGKNEYTTLNSIMIKKIKEKIKIPVKTDGTFDLTKQQELANKYATIEKIKKDLYQQIQKLTSIVVN